MKQKHCMPTHKQRLDCFQIMTSKWAWAVLQRRHTNVALTIRQRFRYNNGKCCEKFVTYKYFCSALLQQQLHITFYCVRGSFITYICLFFDHPLLTLIYINRLKHIDLLTYFHELHLIWFTLSYLQELLWCPGIKTSTALKNQAGWLESLFLNCLVVCGLTLILAFLPLMVIFLHLKPPFYPVLLFAIGMLCCQLQWLCQGFQMSIPIPLLSNY